MESVSEIANSALNYITYDQFPNLPRLAITGLLNDFQYAWLIRLNIQYKFDVLDIARNLCNGENKSVFNATQLRSIEEIRDKFSEYIEKLHRNDDRIILYLSFDGKQINSEWIEIDKYMESNKADSPDAA
jgi:hypothetical protein